jgi:hypothetical protein
MRAESADTSAARARGPVITSPASSALEATTSICGLDAGHHVDELQVEPQVPEHRARDVEQVGDQPRLHHGIALDGLERALRLGGVGSARSMWLQPRIAFTEGCAVRATAWRELVLPRLAVSAPRGGRCVRSRRDARVEGLRALAGESQHHARRRG